MDSAIIYHNPKCGTSRNTLALIRHAGIEPQVVEYLQSPPDKETLANMISQAGLTVHDAIRQKEASYTELGLDHPDLSDAQLMDARLAHPILINRHSVSTTLVTRFCHTSDLVLDIVIQG